MPRITEIKTINIDNNLCKNPFYVRWRNSLGGFEYWMFEWRQDEGQVTSDLEETEVYIEDIDTARARSTTSGINSSRAVNLFAENLTTSEAKGLATIRSSIQIEYWDGTNWLRIKIATGDFLTYRTDSDRHKVSIRVLFDNYYQ